MKASENHLTKITIVHAQITLKSSKRLRPVPAYNQSLLTGNMNMHEYKLNNETFFHVWNAPTIDTKIMRRESTSEILERLCLVLL